MGTRKNRKCPFCSNQKVNRIRRHRWMHSIPFSELYDCPDCRSEFMVVFGFLKFKFNNGYSRLASLMNNTMLE